ncbi:hypothetical protein Pint_09696 [Pistacia integerrima]|uniref:Uncharacterized protein n=1 Tax=Pistacia integerrima TaxID=434235 RepID=A0ACC0XGP6_9ROSI|nr:hypothetical protein Pint_09696 [Pistacia integerrima]
MKGENNEINTFIMVWLSAVASLCYCYAIGKIIPKGFTRLLAIFPVIFIFLILPFNLHAINFVGPTSFFLVWLANFKLLLFAFGKGPLSSYRNLSLQTFIALACFPIKIQHHQSSQNLQKTPLKTSKSPQKHAVKFLLLAFFLLIYNNKQNFHPDIMLFMYCIYLYLSLELTLLLGGALARTLIGIELEPQFAEPYLSTSLQDFWGRRWNLMVSDILRPTVYNPVRFISSRVIGAKWARVPAVLATFLVSGLMHELLFYYFGRAKPRWDVTCFFLLHGLCLAAEMAGKGALKDKWRLPRVVSGPLVVAFVAVTGSRLFIPALLRNEVDVKARREYIAFIEFLNIETEFRHLLDV